MKGFAIELDDDSIVRVCATNEPTKLPDNNSCMVDTHKITFEVPVRGIEEDEDMMCE